MKQFLLFGLAICSSIHLSAQMANEPLTKKELQSLYESGDAKKLYAEALPLYEENAGDDDYNFYMGWALLTMNTNLVKASDHLKYAASKSYRDELVHMYLGIAYYKTYQFDIARISFNNYALLAKKKDQKVHQLDIWLRRIDKLQSSFHSVDGYSLYQLDTSNNAHVRNSGHNMGCGMHRILPDSLPFELAQLAPSGILVSADRPGMADNLYVSVSNADGVSDIYAYPASDLSTYSSDKLKKLSINSSADEIYPFYSSQKGCLYFSSNRTGGVGGYDIYLAQYNSEIASFEAPKALPFPINTPFDDYLYMPDTCGRALLVSNRNIDGTDVGVFYIEPYDTVLSLASARWDYIQQYSQFAGLSKPSAQLLSEVESTNPVHPLPSAPTDSLITLAMNLQSEVDSLQSIILSNRRQLQSDSLPDIQVKELRSEIYRSQKFINTLRNQIIQIHALAEKYDSDRLSDIREVDTNVIVLDREQNGIRVYAYRADQASDSVSTENQQVRQSNAEANHRKTDAVATPVLRNFSINNPSVYRAITEIEINSVIPKQFHYRIQLGALSQAKTPEDFMWIYPLMGERATNSQVTKYYAGEFKSSREAKAALQQLKELGFNDAFLVPFHMGERIGIERARELEFGNK